MSTGRVQYEWTKANVVRVNINLNKNTDEDILDALVGKAKQTEIKRLVRVGIKAEREHKI